MAGQNNMKKFEKLYEESFEQVSRYVVKNCNNIDDAKDIIQNVYMAVFKKIGKVENTSYIIGIARHKVKDFYRFKYKASPVSEDTEKYHSELPCDFDLEELVSVRYDADKVWQYMKNKPVTVAKVFYLYFYAQMTITEISRELGMTESNVKNYLYRNLKELNQKLERKGR